MRWAAILAGVVTAACAGDKPAEAPPATRPAPPAPTAHVRPTDAWLGRWNGVEGTYLELARDGEGYAVTIADLDGPETYPVIAVGEHIEFVRAGRTESIRRATGKETGMKWLADETNCLVITVGSEGFCRK